MFGRGLAAIRSRKSKDQRFLEFVLRRVEGAWAVMEGTGAVFGNAKRSDLESLTIPWPDASSRAKIACVLSAYDDLIENSLRRIEILEEMARNLYCEWFGRFRFPGHEGAHFVDSSLGTIPEGWSVLPLADVCVTMSSGGTPSRADAECWNPAELNWFKTGELRDSLLQESEEKISGDGMSRSSARMFRRGTVLMAIYGASVGRLGVLTRSAACNQAALGMVTDRRLLSQEYLFYCLLELRERFRTIAQGAAQQNLSKEKVASSRCVVPPMVLVENFSEHVSTAWDMVAALLERIAALRQARDLLLPKLISGEIDVSALPVRLAPAVGNGAADGDDVTRYENDVGT